MEAALYARTEPSHTLRAAAAHQARAPAWSDRLQRPRVHTARLPARAAVRATVGCVGSRIARARWTRRGDRLPATRRRAACAHGALPVALACAAGRGPRRKRPGLWRRGWTCWPVRKAARRVWLRSRPPRLPPAAGPRGGG